MGLILMFTGPANGEVMVETLVQYKEHGVKELTDSTFEHLTQVNGDPVTVPVQGARGQGAHRLHL